MVFGTGKAFTSYNMLRRSNCSYVLSEPQCVEVLMIYLPLIFTITYVVQYFASPKGTTIRALHLMEKAGIRGIMMDAVQASAERCTELGDK